MNYKKNFVKTVGVRYLLINMKFVKSVSMKNKKRCEWPTREVLKEKIRNKPFLQIGKEYNVSDNAVRKWCKSYNLPYRASDIKKYTDEEWENI